MNHVNRSLFPYLPQFQPGFESPQGKDAMRPGNGEEGRTFHKSGPDMADQNLQVSDFLLVSSLTP